MCDKIPKGAEMNVAPKVFPDFLFLHFILLLFTGLLTRSSSHAAHCVLLGHNSLCDGEPCGESYALPGHKGKI